MTKHIFFILILVIFSTFLSASEMEDSLLHQIQISKDIAKIDAQIELSYYYRRLDAEKAKYYAELALDELNSNFKNNALEAKAMYCMGLSYYYTMDYQNALDIFFRSLALSQVNDDERLLSDIYFFIGSIYYYYYGDNKQTIDYYNKSINSALRSNNYRILGAVYSSLSNLFRISGSYEKSLEFIYKSRENYAKANYTEGIAWIDYTTGSLYNTLGLYEEALNAFSSSLSIYHEMATVDSVMTGVAICLDQLSVIHTELNNEDLARKYNQEALKYYIQENSRYGISNSLKYKANIEYKSHNYKMAMSLLDSSLSIKKEINDRMGFSSIYSTYGAILIDNGLYQQALDSLEIGLNFAIENKQMKSRIEINRYMAIAYEKLGNYLKAYEYKSEETNVADSIYNAKTTRGMLQLETLFEIESKNNEINQLEQEKLISDLSLKKQKNLRNYLFIMIFLSLIIIVMFFYYYKAKVRSNKELHESKKIVEKAIATKDKFFSILAHDLRNPFNSLLGLTRILKENHTKMTKDEIEKIIDSLYESSNSNYSLLNNLLEWSRTQRGNIDFTPEEMMINESLNNVKKLLSSYANEKEVSIIIDTEPVNIYADKNMITTVLRNLISNAIKYTKNGGEIRVRYNDLNTYVKVSVSDTGIGMDEIDLQRIFRLGENYQVLGTSGEKGTGLGLIICKEFIDEHKGKIWAESELGVGSTFYFTIPKNI
ncbi:MAG: tetratricopeptide repeat-containing sensor histidine kinase [Candidatus Marinimicrobia bacterium]|nr:tetratricopeptide repeat-containing sensor histidine kinase [Candidatus Neomarinimicrobiota bacterium]